MFQPRLVQRERRTLPDYDVRVYKKTPSRMVCPLCGVAGCVHLERMSHLGEVLRLRIARVHDCFLVAIEGEIAELADFSGLAALDAHMQLDLSGVTHINTVGALEFLRLLEAVGGAEASRCAPAVVRQLNLFPALAQQLRVTSVMVGLECPECMKELRAELCLSGRGQIPAVPERHCPSCGIAMEFDEPLEVYLAFLTEIPDLVPRRIALRAGALHLTDLRDDLSIYDH